MRKAALGDQEKRQRNQDLGANLGRPSNVLKLIKRQEKLDTRELQE